MANQIFTELKTSPRLRLGLALILAVLWLNGILSLRDELAAEAKRQIQSLSQIARVRQYATQTEWPERAKQARITQMELEERLWRSSTQGLAQAAVQDWLTQGLSQSGVGRPEVSLVQGADAAKADGEGGPWKIKAKLMFDFSPQSFSAWMSKLASHDRQIVMEQLIVRMEPVPRVEMMLMMPAQKTQ